MGFDLILQNSATKKEYLVSGLVDSGNYMAFIFEDFEMPDGAQPGEYYCAIIWNGRSDVSYEFRDVLLDTVLHTEEGDVQLRDLRPEVFLMKYGTAQSEAEAETPVYVEDKNTEYYYYNGR